MKDFTCGFIGLGLIGGSIAKALKKQNPKIRMLAFDIHEESLVLAQKEGIIDICYSALTEDAAKQLGGCDLLFLCAPVSKNEENLQLLKDHLKEDCILTDVGSVKSTIHQVIEREGLTSRFVGGHPMTGSEKTGYENANELLFENAFYFLTPAKDADASKVERMKELVTGIGAIPLVIDCKKHDYITAAVSHLPHVIAYSLVNLVRENDDDGMMKLIAAGGFKDITRIASSSPAMWQQICLTNTENIESLLRAYIEQLEQMCTYLEQKRKDALFDAFQSAKDYRDSFITTSGSHANRLYEVYLDIPDKAGAIAMTATILALNDISIKNIGIMHNREFQEGVLHIEFYDKASADAAVALLKRNNYTVYEKGTK
ncbi:MAG: prephenate dehydrogenase [Lachnospiraceae bacterium]|nr:prephenate dehydrogenase [Lachnospiraceae bacterium]